jgi:hypothetical protein
MEVYVDPASATTPRDGAVGGALAAGAGALLTFALASRWPPALLANVLGPPPLPAVLAAAACGAMIGAGALAGRRVVRFRGNAPRRAALAAVAMFVAYLLSVVASVAVILVLDRGIALLMVPFSLLGIGLSVCAVLLPWAALPLGASAVMLEGWTRTPPGGIGVRARRRARCISAVMAGAAVALLAAAWG